VARVSPGAMAEQTLALGGVHVALGNSGGQGLAAPTACWLTFPLARRRGRSRALPRRLAFTRVTTAAKGLAALPHGGARFPRRYAGNSFQPSIRPFAESKFTPIMRTGRPLYWNFSK